MDDARRKAAEVLATITESIYSALVELVETEKSAVAAGKGSADALANLESALDNTHGAMDAMREAARPSVAFSDANDPAFYESSNGDTWCLTKDPTSGRIAVMHRPNKESGGKVSYIDVDRFLRESPDGLQHDALRDLMKKRNEVGQ